MLPPPVEPTRLAPPGPLRTPSRNRSRVPPPWAGGGVRGRGRGGAWSKVPPPWRTRVRAGRPPTGRAGDRDDMASHFPLRPPLPRVPQPGQIGRGAELS